MSDYKGQKQCISKSRESNFVSDYGVQRCQITEIVFYAKVLVNDILVGLERILDYTGVGLERFNCNNFACICNSMFPSLNEQ